MNPTHVSTRPDEQNISSERGATMALFGLVLIPLIAISGFAVDMGAWFQRGQDMQAAADAGALAGVVHLPDVAEAESVAIAVVEDNGYIVGDDGIEIEVNVLGANQIEVVIVDDEVETMFTGMFLTDLTIAKDAVAEFVSPVPMGSPNNFIGTGNLDMLGTGELEGFWGATSSYCMNSGNGDRILGRWTGRWYCNPGYPEGNGWPDILNADYDAGGYTFVIDVPTQHTGSVDVDMYDASACRFGSTATDSVWSWRWEAGIGYTQDTSATAGVNTYLNLYEADSTPFDDTDNPLYASVVIPPGLYCGTWNTMFTIPAGQPGRWLLQTTYAEDEATPVSNSFGIWAKRPGDSLGCSSLTDVACPHLYARDHLPIKLDDALVDASGGATFYLAEIGQEHAGNFAHIELWDAAEGMTYLQILDPSGTPVEFTWKTADGVHSEQSNSTCGGAGACLPVAGNPAPFHERLLQLEIQLPSAAQMAGWSDDWWKVRYVSDGASPVTDRTTWSVFVTGDPVHLIPGD